MSSYQEIYNQYFKKIYHLAFRMTGRKEDALDIAQETFLQAFQSKESFKGESHIYTWLYRITLNNCLRFLKNQKRSSFENIESLIYKVSIPLSEEISESEKSAYIFQVKDGCLSGLLRCLSKQQRVAFIFNILLDLPAEQVAGLIGKSENATKILIHRARRNIREFLCRNCSVYDAVNHCKCENLASFSLKQGWIDSHSRLERIEKEIKDLKNEVMVYKTLHEPEPASETIFWLKKLLKGKDLLIFEPQKVK